MSRQKHRSQLDAIDEINMTPLIDLTFLLLIIFMITTPLLENSVDVSPPTMNADKLPKQKSCIIALDKYGNIRLKKLQVSKEELIARLQALHNADPKVNILIRGDGSRPYREVMELMKLVKDHGFSNISLITTPETN